MYYILTSAGLRWQVRLCFRESAIHARKLRMTKCRFVPFGLSAFLLSNCGGASPYRDLAEEFPALPSSVYFVIDSSGSMNEDVRALGGGQESKIRIARRSLRLLHDALGSSSRTTLRAFPGGRSTSCSSGQLVLGPGEHSRDDFRRAVDGLQGAGDTPTAEALRSVSSDIRSSGEPATVILLSDGMSSCDDPCFTAQELDPVTDWDFISIGFDLLGDGAVELRCIADVTGGRYLSASDGAELEELFGDPDQLFRVTG